MLNTSTVLVVENFATFEHKAYNPKTEIESWKFDQDLPKKGFPIRPDEGVNRTSIDHGALVLNRLVGNIEIPYSQNHSDTFTLSTDLQEKVGNTEQSQKTIGTAPEGTKILYSYLTDKVEEKNPDTTLFSIMKGFMESKKTRADFLNHIYEKTKNREIKLDAISMSDSIEELNNSQLMEIEMLDKTIGLILTPANILKQKDIDKKQKLKSSGKEFKDTERTYFQENKIMDEKIITLMKRKGQELGTKGSPTHHRERFKDESVQAAWQNYIKAMQKHINKPIIKKNITEEEFQYMSQILLEGSKALEYDKDKDEFPHFQKPEFAPLLEEGKEIYQNYTKIKENFKAKNIPFFSVDMAKDYGIEVHGLNQDGTINTGNEDSRRPKTLSAEDTFLFPNQKICFPKSYKTNNEMYNEENRGGISSLVPSMAGVFLQARSINPTINMKTFIQTLKKSCEDFGNKKFKPASDKNGLYGGYVVDNEVIERLRTKVQEHYIAQQKSVRRIQNSK